MEILHDRIVSFQIDNAQEYLDRIKANLVGEHDFKVINDYLIPCSKLDREGVYPLELEQLKDEFLALLDSKYEEYSNYYNTYKDYELNRKLQFRKLYPEFFIEEHDDGPDSYVAMLYLNDDYDGGELHFTQLDIKIKPKQGQILLFWSEYPHEVLPIVGTDRYTCHYSYSKNPMPV
jgi:2OG-Fe(II) oxygenase superfamily